MTRTWIDPIYNRTYASVLAAQSDPDQLNPIGCWNDVDLNRIEHNIAYCAEWMLEQRIVRVAPEIVTREEGFWQKNMIPTKSEIDRILNNVRLLVLLSSRNPAIADQLPTIYAGTQISYVLANQIEFALDLMHDQPKLPLEYWEVKVGNGIIKYVERMGGKIENINASTALVAEDEKVVIRGIEYGADAQYQTFKYWSGEPDDLGMLIPNTETQEVSFIMPYRAVSFVANFETHIPRTLTLKNGYISVDKNPRAESGPRTGTYFAGEEIMIIADIAPNGKAVYDWIGTESAIKNIVGATSDEDPSTAILTMPDEDVNLEPHYINAGQHQVSVSGGTGGGWYNYNDTVSISASVPSHYEFAYWSGNTGYLTSTTSSYGSFKMPDVNVSFTAHFNYVYSYNDVQVINGKIKVNNQEVTEASGLRQSTSYTLVPTPPDATYGLYNWTVEGAGSVSGSTFTVGDGNAIITGNYRKLHTLTVTNRNNAGGTNVYTEVEGKTWSVSTNSTVNTHYKFNGWYEDGKRISTSTSLSLTVGTTDRVIEAKYDYYPSYTITVINKNNGGGTTTSEIISGEYFSTSTTEDVGNTLFTGWSGDKSSSSTSIGWYVSGNATITANYRQKEEYTLTVENGTGSGTYLERQSITVTANSPAQGATFTGWSVTSGSLYQSPSGSTSTVKLGRGNATIRANYSNLRTIKVKTNTSTTTYSVVQGNSISISAGSAPSTYEFDKWVTNTGDATFANYLNSSTRVYANAQDSEVEAKYKPIPWFDVTMIDGYVWNGSDWVTSARLIRNSTNEIKMKPAPTGYQFFQWEIYVDGVLQTGDNANDIVAPLAERTNLRNLLRNVTLKATYYIPDPTVTYTLTIERKDGTKEQSQHPVGTDIDIRASWPDQGKEFYKWTGDTAYVAGGVYKSESYVHMPAQNIEIKEEYVDEGFIPEFDLEMKNQYGEVCYYTEQQDPDTGEVIQVENWATRHSYPEGTEVKIRVLPYDREYYFGGWEAVDHDTSEDVKKLIDNLSSENTTITVPNFDVDITPQIVLKTVYELKLQGGLTGGRNSAYYFEGAKADVYFEKTNTDDVQYEFSRWAGASGTDITKIELYDGGMFNVRTPGTANEPQFIKMPGKYTELIANYTTKHRLTLTNATIKDSGGETTGYYQTASTVHIIADTIEGMKFQYWDGDVDTIADIYDPTTTVTTVGGVTEVTAVYSNSTETNGVGYTERSLKGTSVINNDDITIVSGEIGNGFIITDYYGHIYVIVDAGETTSTIHRMTKIYKGGNVYE